MGALALTRASMFAASGCVATAQDAVVSTSETITGRALANERLVLLTNEPALVTIDLAARTSARTPLTRAGRGSGLWGLGEAAGTLYSISEFVDLVRLGEDGTVHPAARFPQAIGNLIDIREGMATQHAVGEPGAPLAWLTDASAALSAIEGPARQALGLSRAEEGVLHLLSCSIPPRVVCWLPGANQLLSFDGRRLAAAVPLETVARIAPARLLAHPESRAIQDAVATAGGTFVVLYGLSEGSDRRALAEFGADGRRLRTLQPSAPIRLLLKAGRGVLHAIDRNGRLAEVPL